MRLERQNFSGGNTPGPLLKGNGKDRQGEGGERTGKRGGRTGMEGERTGKGSEGEGRERKGEGGTGIGEGKGKKENRRGKDGIGGGGRVASLPLGGGMDAPANNQTFTISKQREIMVLFIVLRLVLRG